MTSEDYSDKKKLWTLKALLKQEAATSSLLLLNTLISWQIYVYYAGNDVRVSFRVAVESDLMTQNVLDYAKFKEGSEKLDTSVPVIKVRL